MLSKSAKDITKVIKELDLEIDITFGLNDITLYWENIRIDFQPSSIDRVFDFLKDAKTLNVRFE